MLHIYKQKVPDNLAWTIELPLFLEGSHNAYFRVNYRSDNAFYTVNFKEEMHSDILTVLRLPFQKWLISNYVYQVYLDHGN